MTTVEAPVLHRRERQQLSPFEQALAIALEADKPHVEPNELSKERRKNLPPILRSGPDRVLKCYKKQTKVNSKADVCWAGVQLLKSRPCEWVPAWEVDRVARAAGSQALRPAQQCMRNTKVVMERIGLGNAMFCRTEPNGDSFYMLRVRVGPLNPRSHHKKAG